MPLPFLPDNSTVMTATDPVANLQTLIRCPSVTPAEGGALSAIETMLVPLGFKVDRVTSREDGTPDIENLYARLGFTPVSRQSFYILMSRDPVGAALASSP